MRAKRFFFWRIVSPQTSALLICSHNAKAINALHISQFFRWSGFLLCAIAMFLVIFPMFTFPKKLPPRHKKKKKKKYSVDAVSDDDVVKEKSNNTEQVDKKVSSMGFGKNVRGKVCLLSEYVHGSSDLGDSNCGPRPVLPAAVRGLRGDQY